MMLAFASHVFNKAADEITADDLATIQSLTINYQKHVSTVFSNAINPVGYTFYYSMQNPLSTSQNLLEEKIFHYPTKSSEPLLYWKDLQCFTGLVVLDLSSMDIDIIDDDIPLDEDLEDPEISYMFKETRECTLESLTKLQVYKGCYYQSPTDVTFADSAKIQELSLWFHTTEDMNKILDFPNLQTLIVGEFDDRLTDYSNLSKLEKLESLTIDRVNGISWLSSLTTLKHFSVGQTQSTTDFSVLYGMPNLVTLELLDARELKDIGFVANMPKLQTFSLSGSQVIHLQPLEGKTSLLHLSLSLNNKDVSDLSVVPTLSSLQTLYVSGEDYNAKMPDLSGLTHLETVTVNASHIPSIANSNTIRELKVFNHNSVRNLNASAFSGMANLATLTLSGMDMGSPAGLAQLPNLHTLVLSDSRCYSQDWALIFNLQTLENLYIHKSTLAINEVNIKENSTLKKLYISANKYTAYPRVQGDDPAYGAFTQSLAKFVALEELYLPNIELATVDFVASLPNLRVLDVSGNYITDIGPVANLQNLAVLYCGGNPISNLTLIPERVTVYNTETYS